VISAILQEDEENELEAGKEADETVAEVKTNGIEERLVCYIPCY